MATAFASVPHAEDPSLLREITWETYVTLCDENQSHATQMAYFEGELEIMTVGWLHESAKELVNQIFGVMADCLGIDFRGSGQHMSRTCP
jgi:Uma2 family endonuclease